MKALIFLVAMALAVWALVWWLRKAQAEEELERRRLARYRKKKEKRAISPSADMVWPVIIRPVSGKEQVENEFKHEEPSMTAIEYESSDSSEILHEDRPSKLAG